MARVFLTLILTILMMAPPKSLAHTSDTSKVELALDENSQYQLTITIDILHLIKKQQVIMGDDSDVINTLNNYSLLQQKQLLRELESYLTRHSFISFDGVEQMIAPLTGLQLNQLKRILRHSADLSEYQAQLQANGEIPENSTQMHLRFASLLGDVQLTVVRPQAMFITKSGESGAIELTPSAANTSYPLHWLDVAQDYLYQGFIHILPRGLDHILFVLALFLFAQSRKSLIWQVSVFTLAHTITLALGIYQVVNIPSHIVEPLIALSIIYVALENIIKPSSTKIRLSVIFAFGLLHGLGFASVLIELGLPSSQYLLSLVAFNFGVEFGQLTVIALAFFCLAWAMNKSWYQTRLVLALNSLITLIASYWLVERLW